MYSVLLVILVWMLFPFQLQAALPLDVQSTSFKTLSQTFQIIQPGRLLQATQQNTLHPLSHHVDPNRVTHTRLQQHYAGYPVFGGYAILHGTQAIRMNGIVFPDLAHELGQPPQAFKANARQALKHVKDQYQGQRITQEEVTPVVYLDEQHKAFWAYQIRLYIEHPDRIPEKPVWIVEAGSFQPLIQWNDLKTAHALIHGLGFGGNVKTGQYQFGQELPKLELRRNPRTRKCYMENALVKVVDMKHQYFGTPAAVEFFCQDSAAVRPLKAFWTGYEGDGYDLINGAFSPLNDALYIGTMTNQMYLNWYDTQALTDNGKPMQSILRVHYGHAYENAFWDGSQMNFGDGDSTMYPLVSLSVGAHEISHGFTEQHSGLVYYGQAGGINEAFSDMAAQAVEYYATGKNSWEIGSEIMKEHTGVKALRFLKHPSEDGKSIDRADQYQKNMDVHHSSGVYNRLFHQIAIQEGWDTRKAFHVMLKANQDYWTPYATFAQAACGVLSAAKDLGYSTEEIKTAMDEAAIKYQSCR